MRSTPMAAAKTERLLNLVIALLSTRRALPRAAIRRSVEAYRDAASDEAFERMFERDKDELRDLGIPLVTEDLDVLFDDEPAYRIDRAEYALPDLDMTPEQLSLLAFAGRTWTEASLGGAAVRALRKIEASAQESDTVAAADAGADAGIQGPGPVDVLSRIETRVRTSEPAFEAVRGAVSATRPIAFDYRGRSGSSRRRVQPWAIAAWHGRWYLTGLDVDRADRRIFRLDRIEGEVATDGAPGSYTVPDDHDPRAVVAAWLADGAAVSARLRIRPGKGHALRRRATDTPDTADSVDTADRTDTADTTAGPEMPADTPAGDTHVATEHTRPSPTGEWDVVHVTGADLRSFADEIVGHGADVVVEEPPDLRDAVIERLGAVLAAHGGPR